MRLKFPVFLLWLTPFTVSAQSTPNTEQLQPNIADTTFVNIKDFCIDISYDMKYATQDNFLKQQVYDCPKCYLRAATARALCAANEDFLKDGYRIKLFDCYRPLDIQNKMWEIVPNPSYVANPATGSIHNRGGAVDITLVDLLGNELDMGTAFDHFGPESAITYSKLTRQVRKNRRYLQKVMARHNFKVLASEWWHFNFQSESLPKLANFSWKCD